MTCKECKKDCPTPFACEDYLADVRKRVFCVKCGVDITQARFMYIYGKDGGRYCYDCAEKERNRGKKRRSKSAQIRDLYKKGSKPTEIAKVVGLPTEEVYIVLSGRKHEQPRAKTETTRKTGEISEE